MKNEFILSVSETAPDRSSNSSQERTCEECGRQFFSSSQWAYKLTIKQHTSWFCRYNCVRSAEKKLEDAKAERKITMKSKKPSKEILEKDLRAGLPIAVIAKKHEGSVQSVHNWIKSYGLAGIQGVKKPKVEEIAQNTPLVEEMVQGSPTLAEIEQFHTDNEVQALPRVEFSKTFNIIMDDPEDSFRDLVDKGASDCAEDGKTKDFAAPPAPLETVDDIWLNVHDELATLERLYVAQAKKSFRERLADMVIAVAGHGDNKPQESKHE